MRRNDIKLPRPQSGGALPVTASGDLALVSGSESYRQARIRALSTSPGRMLHRPQFGAGIQGLLGLKGAAIAQRIRADVAAQLYRDERTLPERVTVVTTTPATGRVDVSFTATLVDGSKAVDSL